MNIFFTTLYYTVFKTFLLFFFFTFKINFLQHAKWVQSELKKDAILASGKHLGVEEMLFVVQARNSESCHPAYVNHVSDTTSRQVVPVHQIHPSMYGYTLTKRKRDWKIEAQQEEAQIEKNLLSLQLKQDKKAKKAKKLALKQAKINAANGNRKDRRDYAKQQEEMKEEIKKQKVLNQKKLKEKQKNEQKGKGKKIYFNFFRIQVLNCN